MKQNFRADKPAQLTGACRSTDKHGQKPNGPCVGVGFVRRPRLLVGGVHSVTTILVEVERQKGLREIEGEQREEEVGWNGELKVEE